jgi:hypothetical protein
VGDVIYYTLLIGGCIFSLVDISLQLRLLLLKKISKQYLLPHAIKLITAFIVMLSAFSSTTFNFLETPYKETWPSFVGLPILYFWAIKQLIKTPKIKASRLKEVN